MEARSTCEVAFKRCRVGIEKVMIFSRSIFTEKKFHLSHGKKTKSIVNRAYRTNRATKEFEISDCVCVCAFFLFLFVSLFSRLMEIFTRAKLFKKN